ncbi:MULTISPECIES: RagB/SusD family nutrient uptake outer membrane protein [Bacteroides]|uniref:RagB/SusD family nutrient uptake outer membrane protein n=1 Tax=Bacteroides TaxID=816 RepID=UPI000E54AE5A|nr:MULTISPECIES: RagB/SusD family nutrient uptake outer membrane protein [Bacteroides]QNL39442.1 RagB/SusD family nutrient uptake outer membrane protein [Bacteroides sp. M10]RGR01186.1 RagB/SusD family nutrient uptake outer membrane protein [Bacteroides sp. AF26-7BH]RGY30981.1 RagB/SusD family nutrient uptake outer membrane protein [Bacteroides sp. OF02-3LB]
MKKVKTILYGAALLLLVNACDSILDREVVLSLTEDDVLTLYNNTQSRAVAIYNYLPSGFRCVDGAMMASASDEAEYTLETSSIQMFNVGSWNAKNNPDGGSWWNNFRGIYLVNHFLANSDNLDLEMYRLNPDDIGHEQYQNRLDNIKRWKYEVRFLRAYFYFELIKRYGGVPVITRPVEIGDSFPRNTLDSCVNFIVKECDDIALGLPIKYTEQENLGRATRGAVLALKSRVLLYAASDLFNSPEKWASGYANKDLISVKPIDRKERWKKAADAAKDVIDLTDAGYALSNNYQGVFRSYTDAEIILARRDGASNDFEKTNYPVGYDLGNSGNTPSLNLLDDYEMLDGTAFDWNNKNHAANPYKGRDPRLAFTILSNMTKFNGRPVECWTGGRDGKGVPRATKTGQYLLKYIDPELNLLEGRTSVHTWILIRLAEVYLNYIEALNEYQPTHSDIKIYYDKIRRREGIKMPELPDGLDQDAVRQKIRHERRIELAFEDHRLWDARRWMIAADNEMGKGVLNIPLRGLEILNRGGVPSYSPIEIEKRNFEPKMYLYPIPQGDLDIAGWSQNPLW